MRHTLETKASTQRQLSVCVTSQANTVPDSEKHQRQWCLPRRPFPLPIPGVCHRRYRHHRSRRRQYCLTIARQKLDLRVSSMFMLGEREATRSDTRPHSVSFFASFMMEKCHLFISKNLHSKLLHVKICHVRKSDNFKNVSVVLFRFFFYCLKITISNQRK